MSSSPSSQSFSDRRRHLRQQQNSPPTSRRKRKSKKLYHRIALKHDKLRAIKEEQDEQDHSCASDSYIYEPQPGPQSLRQRLVAEAKVALFSALLKSGGDAATPECQRALDQLLANYECQFDPKLLIMRSTESADFHQQQCQRRVQMEDTWISLSKLPFRDCIGFNERNNPMYTLDRISFANLFRPAKLVCSIQGIFHVIEVVDGTDDAAVKRVPRNLLEDVRNGNHPVRTYNVVTAFTIEPSKPRFGNASPNKWITEPIEGVMTTQGYILPYPKQNRFSLWFTGASLEVVSPDSAKYHDTIFNNPVHKRSLLEKSKQLAAQLFMGATMTSTGDEMEESQGAKITYELNRPVASYIDLLYMDETCRIMRSSNGEVQVLSRVPQGDLVDRRHSQSPSSPAGRRRGREAAAASSLASGAAVSAGSPPMKPTRHQSPSPTRSTTTSVTNSSSTTASPSTSPSSTNNCRHRRSSSSAAATTEGAAAAALVRSVSLPPPSVVAVPAPPIIRNNSVSPPQLPKRYCTPPRSPVSVEANLLCS